MSTIKSHNDNIIIKENPKGVEKLNRISAKLKTLLKENMFDYQMWIEHNTWIQTNVYIVIKINNFAVTPNFYNLFKEVVNETNEISINILASELAKISLGVEGVYDEHPR